MEIKEMLLVYLSRKTCVTLEDLKNDLGLKESTAKVYLSELSKEGVITRKWAKTGGKKFRLYCLNSTVIKDLHLG